LQLQETLLAALQPTQGFTSARIENRERAVLEARSERCRVEALGCLGALYRRLMVGGMGMGLDGNGIGLGGGGGGAAAGGVPRGARRDSGNGNRNRDHPRGLCESAIAYRENRQGFAELTRPVRGTSTQEWECAYCRRRVSRTSLAVSSGMHLWIGPSGLFKAHCGNGVGWMCIWEREKEGDGDGDECRRQFNTRKELLLHMKRVHVRNNGNRNETAVAKPSDSRRNDVDSCGYGVTIQGRNMIEVDLKFIVLGNLGNRG
jgi:hypothetical protein